MVPVVFYSGIKDLPSKVNVQIVGTLAYTSTYRRILRLGFRWDGNLGRDGGSILGKKVCEIPHSIRNPRFHRWRHSNGAMQPEEVVVGHVQRDCSFVVFQLL